MGFISDISNEFGKLTVDKRALRKFGLTMTVALGVLGAIVFWKGSHPERAFWIWTPAGLFLLFALLLPTALKPVHKIWMGLAFVMGWFVSRLILTILYYLVITPISLLMRLFSKDLLSLRIDKNASSYWIKRTSEGVKSERYLKLF